ncbi:MAG: peptidyl-prolyl cis-trans isomerase [Geminicoccaceae bacterium]
MRSEKPGWPIGRLLREPLVHFVVVGVVLFGAYGVLQPNPQSDEGTQRIEITMDDLRQLAVVWLAQGRPAPTPQQMRALVQQKITSEVLYREAVALGLDQDDEIIKRRLAQKMDFLVADVAAMVPPSAAELETWFDRNASEFALPPHVSFRHLYFSFDRRGDGTQDAAAAGLARIGGLPADAPEASAIADPFMFRNYYGDATPEQMAKEFGPGFAEALFQLQPGSWQGPIESGYGWHLIWIDSLDASRIPTFEEVKPRVLEAWQAERYREVRQRALAEMRSRYAIIVPPLGDLDLDDLTIPTNKSPSAP